MRGASEGRDGRELRGRALERAAAAAWIARENERRHRGAKLTPENGGDPPDAAARDPRGERIGIEVTELHRVGPHEAAALAEEIVPWTRAELRAAMARAVARKSERLAAWPSALRRRFDRFVLLLVLDERQRLEEEAPPDPEPGAFSEAKLLRVVDGRVQLLTRRT